jgi:uncharacterized protein YqjF (DUF2071 family)
VREELLVATPMLILVRTITASVDELRTRITPDPPPLGARVVLRQRWDDLASFHWRYPVDVVAALLPPGLDVDVHDGSAWVGLIPFHMRAVRIGPGPVVPYLGSFVEINVRTYVRDAAGHRGVWFFSLDVPRTPIVAVARTVFSLPYCWSAAEHTVVATEHGEEHRYRARRRWPRPSRDDVPHCDLAYTLGPQVPDDEVSELDHFVSARWSLFTLRRGRLVRGDVDHARWPVHRLHEHRIDQTLVQAAGLPAPEGEPHALASPGVAVQLAWLRRVAAASPSSPV